MEIYRDETGRYYAYDPETPEIPPVELTEESDGFWDSMIVLGLLVMVV